MSSWNNGRVHFREKKTNITKNMEPAVVSQQDTILLSPTKYISSKTGKNDAVICCIALNEEPYIDEWINYHTKLGFSHIYIYDNSISNTLKNKNSDNVTVHHIVGKEKQLIAYNLFVASYKKKHKWAAFIDCDEFIVLKKHNNIIDFLKDYDSCSCIGLNWKMFGTSNQVSYSPEPVINRFLYSSNLIDKHIKCICKIFSIDNYVSPHYPILRDGIIYDTDNNTIEGPFNEKGNDNIACIHHYYTKSEEEFRAKIERGKADIPEKRSLDELIDIHSKNNDVFNSDAWNFYSK